MLPRRRTVMVCSFCGSHYREEESNIHGESCGKNPKVRGCDTCCRRDRTGKCKLELIPIDFLRKIQSGRNCSSWTGEENERSKP